MNNNSNKSKIQIGSEQKLQDSQIKDLSQAFLSQKQILMQKILNNK